MSEGGLRLDSFVISAPHSIWTRRGTVLALCLLVLGGGGVKAIHFGVPNERITSTLIIAPSNSKLAGGTAKLVVGVLSRAGSAYVGEYRIKVFPYFFKNESGRLSINISEPMLRRMVGGHPTNFAGRAVTTGTGETRKVTARAIPKIRNEGALTFTVATENGPLVFNTSYRIAPP